jgi:hypothetical protein
LALRPVLASNEADCNVVKGTVVKIHEGGVNDVVFRLKEDSKIYYMNRGLEAGLTFEDLTEKVMDKEITIWSAKHWTPLDLKGRVNHICKVSFKEEILYSEF